MRHVSSIFQLLSLGLLLILVRINGDEEEDEFIEKYGNCNETTGVWPAVRNISSDEEKLKLLCKRAHAQMGLGAEDVVNFVKFEEKLLSFHNFNETTNRRPVKVDMLRYGIERLPPNNQWYFTKGTKSDCVFYLMLFDAVGNKFRLGLETCGVRVPE